MQSEGKQKIPKKLFEPFEMRLPKTIDSKNIWLAKKKNSGEF